MTYAFWNHDEDVYLRKGWVSSELTVADIAEHLKRSERGCSDRALSLKLGPKVRAGRSDWTHERVELLKNLWATDLSTSAIAAKMKVSKNTVAGKADRLKLPARSIETVRLNTSLNRPQNMGRKLGLAPPKPVAPPVRLQPQPTPVHRVHEAPGSATLLTLETHMCKWPIGDPALAGFAFCGRRRGDGPYCPAHAQIAYVPRKDRTEAQAAGDESRRHKALIRMARQAAA